MGEELVPAGVAVVAKVIKNVLIRRKNVKRKVHKGKFKRVPSIEPGYLKMVERQARDLKVWSSNPGTGSNFSLDKL